MERATQPEFVLRPWDEDDLALAQRLMGDAAMTVYLGGPEPLAQITRRHQRYVTLNRTGSGRLFVIAAGPERVAAGSVRFWEKDWDSQSRAATTGVSTWFLTTEPGVAPTCQRAAALSMRRQEWFRGMVCPLRRESAALTSAHDVAPVSVVPGIRYGRRCVWRRVPSRGARTVGCCAAAPLAHEIVRSCADRRRPRSQTAARPRFHAGNVLVLAGEVGMALQLRPPVTAPTMRRSGPA